MTTCIIGRVNADFYGNRMETSVKVFQVKKSNIQPGFLFAYLCPCSSMAVPLRPPMSHMMMEWSELPENRTLWIGSQQSAVTLPGAADTQETHQHMGGFINTEDVAIINNPERKDWKEGGFTVECEAYLRHKGPFYCPKTHLQRLMTTNIQPTTKPERIISVLFKTEERNRSIFSFASNIRCSAGRQDRSGLIGGAACWHFKQPLCRNQ